MSVMGGRRTSGGGRVTLVRIAEELGVSSMTVSNAYNRPGQLSKELRERIFETAERLGYAGPDPVARSLRRRETNVAGVLYSNPLSYAFDDPAQVLFLKGVAEATETAGMRLLLVPGSVGTSPEERASAASGAAADGFIVYSMADDDPLVEAAIKRRLPIIIVDQPRREDALFIGIDDKAAARAAAEHLLSLGHERFAVVSFALAKAVHNPGIADTHRQQSATFRVSRARLEGYAEALTNAGLSWSDVPVYECSSSAKALGKEAAGLLLSRVPHPMAILALSDQLALGAMEAAQDMGLSVPENLSVVGFDDVPEAVKAKPPLTTVCQDHAEKGLLAGRLLVERLRGETPNRPEYLAARLVVRGSTAHPKG